MVEVPAGKGGPGSFGSVPGLPGSFRKLYYADPMRRNATKRLVIVPLVLGFFGRFLTGFGGEGVGVWG